MKDKPGPLEEATWEELSAELKTRADATVVIARQHPEKSQTTVIIDQEGGPDEILGLIEYARSAILMAIWADTDPEDDEADEGEEWRNG